MYSEKLIVALDYPTVSRAIDLVNELGDSVLFYKIGLELIATGDYTKLSDYLIDNGKKVFFDAKLYDIPRTVAAAVKSFNHLGADFITVHGDEEIVKAAVDASAASKIIAVTVLTSLDQDGLRQMGITQCLKDLVLYKAQKSYNAGADGVVVSGVETRDTRNLLEKDAILVVPGIRDNNLEYVARKGGKTSLMMIPGIQEKIINDDDQKRTTTVRNVLYAGADYIVVGRQIRNAASPRDEAENIQEEISRVLAIP